MGIMDYIRNFNVKNFNLMIRQQTVKDIKKSIKKYEIEKYELYD